MKLFSGTDFIGVHQAFGDSVFECVGEYKIVSVNKDVGNIRMGFFLHIQESLKGHKVIDKNHVCCGQGHGMGKIFRLGNHGVP